MSSLIAIDLGSHAAKVSVFQRSGRKWVLDDQYTAAVPQDGTEVPDNTARLAALDVLIDDHPEWRAPANQIVCAWPNERGTLHRIVVPFTDKAQVLQTLPFAIEGEVPFDMEEMLLGWRVLDVTDVTIALAVLAPKEGVSERIEALKSRQLNPASIFVDGDVAGHWSKEDGTIAVIDVGHARTLVSVVRDGVVERARAIDVGGRDFTLAVQSAMSCTWDVAEAIKHGQEVIDNDITEPKAGNPGANLPEAARVAADQQMGLLLAEIRSTLVAAEDALDMGIDRVVLTGGGARLHPFNQYLEKDLGVRVDMVLDADGDPVSGPYSLGHSLAVALHSPGVSAPVNMRIGDLVFKGGIDVLRAVATLMFSGVAFFAVAAVVLFAFRFADLGEQQRVWDDRVVSLITTTFPEIPASSVTTITAESIMTERMRLEKQKAARLGLSLEPPTIQTLEDITKSFPPPGDVTVNVSKLTITGETITFDAETDGYASSAAVEAALKRNRCFADTTIEDKGKRGSKVRFVATIPIADVCKKGSI